MTTFRLLIFLIVVSIFAIMAINAIKSQRSVTDRDFVAQVLDQYIHYYCPTAGTCTRKKALARLRRDWPDVYNLGFSILETDEK